MRRPISPLTRGPSRRVFSNRARGFPRFALLSLSHGLNAGRSVPVVSFPLVALAHSGSMNTLILEVRDKAGDGGYPCALRLLVREGTQELMNFRLSAAQAHAIPKAPDLPGAFRELVPRAGAANVSASDKFKKLAQWLHELILGPDVIERLKTYGLLAGESNALHKCRLVLDIQAPKLRGLRFEMMAKGANRPALNRDCSVVRGPIDIADLALPCDGPIRVLVVIGSRAEDPSVRAEQEIAELRKGLAPFHAEIVLRVLDRPAIDALIAKDALPNVRAAVKRDLPRFPAPRLALHRPRRAG